MIKKDNNNIKIEQIDIEIDYLKIEIEKLELEKSIRKILSNINDNYIIEIIKNKYPLDYYDYLTSMSLFNSYVIKNNTSDLNKRKEISTETYKLYKDLIIILKDFYRLYLYTKYEDDEIILKIKN